MWIQFGQKLSISDEIFISWKNTKFNPVPPTFVLSRNIWILSSLSKVVIIFCLFVVSTVPSILTYLKNCSVRNNSIRLSIAILWLKIRTLFGVSELIIQFFSSDLSTISFPESSHFILPLSVDKNGDEDLNNSLSESSLSICRARSVSFVLE